MKIELYPAQNLVNYKYTLTCDDCYTQGLLHPNPWTLQLYPQKMYLLGTL